MFPWITDSVQSREEAILKNIFWWPVYGVFWGKKNTSAIAPQDLSFKDQTLGGKGVLPLHVFVKTKQNKTNNKNNKTKLL